MADTWDQARNSMHDFIDRVPGLTDREKAERKAQYDAEHDALREGAAKYDRSRDDYLKGVS